MKNISNSKIKTEKKDDKTMVGRYIIKELMNRGATQVVVSSGSHTNTQIKFVNNSITSTTAWQKQSVNIFLNFNKSIVSTSVEKLDRQSLDMSIKNLLKFAKFAQPNPDYNGIAKGPFKYKAIAETYDKKIENLGEGAIDIVENGINSALKEGASRVSGNLECGTSNLLLQTSEKVEVFDKGTSAYFTIRSFTDKDASGHKTACSRILKKFDYISAAEKSAYFAVNSKNPEKIEQGKYDIIFDPMSFSVLLDNIASATSVFSVEAGLSFLTGMVGKKVASDKVTITDDGILPNGYASSLFDDEGYPSQRKFLVKDGTMKTYLHNSSSAKKYGVSSTGNAGLIAPEPTNIVLQNGKISENSLFKSIDKGLYITNLWYTRYQNHATGEFSTIPRDAVFIIENGQIKKAVKNIRISENMKNILNNTEQISDIPEQVMGWETENPVTTPFVYVKNVNITKSV